MFYDEDMPITKQWKCNSSPIDRAQYSQRLLSSANRNKPRPPPPSPKSLVCACNNTLDSRSVCQTKHLRDISKYFSCHNLRAERNTGLCLNHKRLSETFTNNFKLQQTYRSKSELLVDSMIDIERITLPNTVGVRCVGGSWAVTFWRGGSIGRRIRVAQSA